jgi:hypothetical protein
MHDGQIIGDTLGHGEFVARPVTNNNKNDNAIKR